MIKHMIDNIVALILNAIHIGFAVMNAISVIMIMSSINTNHILDMYQQSYQS